MSRIEELSTYSKKELIDRILMLEEQLRDNDKIAKSIKDGIVEGLTTPSPYHTLASDSYMKGSVYMTDLTSAIVDKFDEFKRLAAKANELNEKIRSVVGDEFVLPDFITGEDERYNTEKLLMLDPFNVTEGDIERTERILKRVEMLKQAFKRGYEVYEVEGEIKGSNRAYDSMLEFIEVSKFSKRVKIELGILIGQLRRGMKLCSQKES